MLKKICLLSLLLTLALLAGCASVAYPIRSMDFEPEAGGWRLEYYPRPMSSPNRFMAFYELDGEITIEIGIRLPDTYYEMILDAWVILIPLKLDHDTADWCSRQGTGYVNISFRRAYRKIDAPPPVLPGVSFDSNSVYVIRSQGQVVYGEYTGKKLNEGGIYNLTDLEALESLEDRPSKAGGWKTYVQLPAFNYFFSLTCADYEAATLVIDGIYYKNKLLPPLKVHMRYQDFSKVPQRTP